jgi:hypothetical protein
MKVRLLAAVAVVATIAGAAGGTGLATSTPKQAYVTNGGVTSVADTGTVTYIGGSFTQVGPRTGPSAAISATTGNVIAGDEVSGGENTVYAVVVDGSGGYFVGGDFTHVGGLARHDLAHILPNGAVDPTFDPEPNNDVMAIAVSGSTVYVGGQFFSIDGQSRSRIAALDFSGAASSWNPGATATVRALAVAGGYVYVGGDFLGNVPSLGGAPRYFAGRVPTTSSTADPNWDPHPSSSVYAIVVSGSTIYLGGAFTAINQPFVTADFVAAVDDSTGAVISGFLPPGGANQSVYSLALADGTLYVGGTFSQMNGAQRRGAAALDAETGALMSWDPDPQSAVAALAAANGVVYAGGSFSNIGGLARNGIAALDPITGAATSWNPNAGSEVLALAATGSTVFAGGVFSSVNMVPRSYLAAIDDSTGQVTSWDPEPNFWVLSLAATGSHVWAGGLFSEIGAQARQYVAEINPSTGAAETSWDAGIQATVGGEVNAILPSGAGVYIGGVFTNVDGQTRNYVAELDSLGAPVIAWNANANDEVAALALSGSTLYIGGSFTQVGGQTRHHIAAVDGSTGAPLSWDPDANNTVEALAVSASTVYVGGDFTHVGGQARTFLAAIDPATGLATSWNPSPDSVVEAIAENGPNVFVGGQFSSIGGATRNDLAEVDAASGTAKSFDPEPNAAVQAITGVSNTLDVGGAFTGFDLGANEGFAQFQIIQRTLTVAKSGSGSGTVASSLDGIACGATCSASYDDGTVVTLNATATAGSTFAGWSGGGCSGNGSCTVTLSADATVIAKFVSGTFAAPTVTGFSPGHGGLHATVTVTGTNFTGTTAVKLGGVNAAFTVANGTQLTFTVPSGAPGSGQIAVTNPAGTATSSGTFSIDSPPAITSLSPTSGPIGTPVTITGTSLGGTVAVQIGSLITVPTSVSPTQVVFTVPPGAATGLVKALGSGGSATSPGIFTVTP